MDKKVLEYLLPYFIGIIIYNYINLNIKIVFILLIISLIYTFYTRLDKKLNKRSVFFLIIFISIIYTNSRNTTFMQKIVSKDITLSGLITDVREFEDKESLVIKVNKINNIKIKKENILINIYKSKNNFRCGDYIVLNTKIKLAKENTNPNLYNYRKNLMSRGIFVIGSSMDKDIIEIKEKFSKLYTIKNIFKYKIIQVINKNIERSNKNLIKGLILGDTSLINNEDRDLYGKLGISHLLAVSGLHIGIISSLLFFIFRILYIRKNTGKIFTIIILWLYAFFIGFPVSVLRATICFTIREVSKIIHKPYYELNNILLSIFILLIINPNYIFNIAFILSYFAVISLFIINKRINIGVNNKILKESMEIIGVQIGLFPILTYYFNYVSLLGLITNIILVPIASLGLKFVIIMLILSFFSNRLVYLIGIIVNNIFNFYNYLLLLFKNISINIIRISSLKPIEIIIYYCFLLISININKFKKLKKDIVKSIIILFTITIVFIQIENFIENKKKIEIHFIDVGQGDSILIRSKNKNYLFDTGGSLFGGFDIGQNITLPYLEKLGIKRLDGLFISHFDEDHFQGSYALFDNIKIDKIYSSYYNEDAFWKAELKRLDIKNIILKSGDSLVLSDNMYLKVLWPVDIKNTWSNNNKSLVCEIKIFDKFLYLTGDIEKESELILKDIIENKKGYKILKVPHHGSNTSSSDVLLDAINPDIAIIQVGRENRYNHPSRDVISRYKKRNIDIYSTSNSGMIKLSLTEKNIAINEFLYMGEIKKYNIIECFINNPIILIYILTITLMYIMLKSNYKNEVDIYDLPKNKK